MRAKEKNNEYKFAERNYVICVKVSGNVRKQNIIGSNWSKKKRKSAQKIDDGRRDVDW